MSLKCEECGLVGWVGETSCSRCGANLTANLSGGTYSGSRTNREQAISKHARIRPVFKALLYSFIIELVVFVLTAGPMVGSLMRHSSAGPRNSLSDLLATFGFFFHFPSLVITFYLELIILAPLVQIALMTGILTLIFRWRRPKHKDQLQIFSNSR